MIDVEYISHMGSDLSVVNAARVSFDAESDWVTGSDISQGGELSVRDQKLINFLAKHKHKSPFNHAFVSFRVTAPVFVARQLVKHEYLPWNEISRRYVEDKLSFYYPEEFRSQPENVKQGSGEPLQGTSAMIAGVYWRKVMEECEKAYHSLLNTGVCREQARGVLPQAMMTTWIWSGSLYAFAKMCDLRVDSHAQAESGEVAQPILDNLYALFPHSTDALMHYGVS